MRVKNTSGAPHTLRSGRVLTPGEHADVDDEPSVGHELTAVSGATEPPQSAVEQPQPVEPAAELPQPAEEPTPPSPAEPSAAGPDAESAPRPTASGARRARTSPAAHAGDTEETP